MDLQEKECWYVLFVNTNEEEKVKTILEKEVGDSISTLFQQENLEKEKMGNGRWLRESYFQDMC